MDMIVNKKMTELYTCGFDKQLIIWSIESFSSKQIIQLSSQVCSIALSVSEKELYLGLDNGKIMVIETATGSIKGEFEGHQGRVTGLSVSQDETKLVSVGFDLQLIIWRTGTIRSTTQTVGFHTNRNQMMNINLQPGVQLYRKIKYTPIYQKPRNYILALLTNEQKEIFRLEFEHHDKDRVTYNQEQLQDQLKQKIQNDETVIEEQKIPNMKVRFINVEEYEVPY